MFISSLPPPLDMAPEGPCIKNLGIIWISCCWLLGVKNSIVAGLQVLGQHSFHAIFEQRSLLIKSLISLMTCPIAPLIQFNMSLQNQTIQLQTLMDQADKVMEHWICKSNAFERENKTVKWQCQKHAYMVLFPCCCFRLKINKYGYRSTI